MTDCSLLLYFLFQAEKEKQLSYEIHVDEKQNARFKPYIDEILSLYQRVSVMLLLASLS